MGTHIGKRHAVSVFHLVIMGVGGHILQDKGGGPRKVNKGPLEVARRKVLLAFREVHLREAQVLLNVAVAVVFVLSRDSGEFLDRVGAIGEG